MRLYIAGSGPLYGQAKRLADAAGYELVPDPAQADRVLPATEDDALLKTLDDRALFDPAAWAVCSSRFASDAFLREIGIPTPAYFPDGSEPYLVKPDRGSFGRGIWVTDDYCEVGGAVNAGFVTEEELPGDVWSVAVTGKPGAYASYPAAKLIYDGLRQRVGAACLPDPYADALSKTAVTIAAEMGLRGILEVEAIFHLGEWKVIDLNARLPMHTGDALLELGINLLEELVGVFR